MGDLLGLHAMALEDTREFGQRPKVDVYEKHVLVVFYTARLNGETGRVAHPIEVHVYVSGDFVVTVQREACDLLDRLHEALLPEGTDVEDYLVYRIFDTLTDAWYPVINAIEARVDALECEVLERARREQLADDLPAAPGGPRAPPAGRRPARPLPAGGEAIRNLAGLSRTARASTCATSPTTSPGCRRVPAPERGPPRPGQHLLQRQRRPPQPRRPRG